jgi:D-sedoheptulose 7-phosphate isomerase
MKRAENAGSILCDFTRQMSNTIAALHLPRIARTAGLLSRTIYEGGTIWAAGNGGSAAIADHLCCDLGKCVAAETGRRVSAVSLCSNTSLLTAIANDLCFDAVFEWQLEQNLRAGDAVVLISSSGRSSNVLRACHLANHRGARTFALVGFDGGPLAVAAQVAVRVDVHDYGIVESTHLAVVHMLSRAVAQSLGSSGARRVAEVSSCVS